jgi:hypothetical protein
MTIFNFCGYKKKTQSLGILFRLSVNLVFDFHGVDLLTNTRKREVKSIFMNFSISVEATQSYGN